MSLLQKVKRIFHKPVKIGQISELHYGRFFPPKEEVYVVNKWYADASTYSNDEYEEDIPAGLELRIFLKASDWYKFQNQPFYQELIQYLDSLKIRKAEEHLVEEQD